MLHLHKSLTVISLMVLSKLETKHITHQWPFNTLRNITYVSDDRVGTVLTIVEPRFAGRAVLLDGTLTVAPATVVLGFQRQTPAAVIRHRRALVHFH